jgi:SAM-dependent methyltransferase
MLTGGRVAPGPHPRALAAEAAQLARRLSGPLAEREAPDYGDDVLEAPSRALLARLADADVAEVERRLEPAQRAVWEQAAPATRQRLALTYGTHHRVPALLAKTGLTPDMPPPTVHAMARSAEAAGGSPWHADLVAGAAERAGREIPEAGAVLDFGCSSGRVTRVLRAWRPDVRWLGCDPNADAVAWAAAHLPGIEFFRSPQHPPLPLDARSLDVVYAISIWSHFGERAALEWLEEMRRLLKPGGLLVLTTHGPASVAAQLGRGIMLPEDAQRCTTALLRHGHWFKDAFGPRGDWEVADPGWGMAYLTPEWLLARALPAWSLRLYEPGREDGNQDLYVFART